MVHLLPEEYSGYATDSIQLSVKAEIRCTIFDQNYIFKKKRRKARQLL